VVTTFQSLGSDLFAASLRIVNLDYLTEKIALENKNAADELNDAKSDF
jgi:hypothetical protein